MRNKIIISAILIFSVLLTSFTILFFSKRIDKKELPGEILISWLENEDNMIIYTPSLDKKEKFTLKISSYKTFYFSENKHKILSISKNSIDGKINEIEYNRLNKETTEIQHLDLSNLENLKYVPKSNQLSYIKDNQLLIYDRGTNQTNKLLSINDGSYLDGNGIYSWNNDGTKVFYNDTYDTISVYDRTTGKSKKILDGHEPILSPDDNYIFYEKPDGKRIIKDMTTGKEWIIETQFANVNAVFSPNSKYLLISKEYRGIADIRYYKIYVLDFRNKKSCILFSGKRTIPGVDWK